VPGSPWLCGSTLFHNGAACRGRASDGRRARGAALPAAEQAPARAAQAANITDQDIDSIIQKGQRATEELNNKMTQFTENAMKFTLDGGFNAYEFKEEEEAPEDAVDLKQLIGARSGLGLGSGGRAAAETGRVLGQRGRVWPLWGTGAVSLEQFLHRVLRLGSGRAGALAPRRLPACKDGAGPAPGPAARRASQCLCRGGARRPLERPRRGGLWWSCRVPCPGRHCVRSCAVTPGAAAADARARAARRQQLGRPAQARAQARRELRRERVLPAGHEGRRRGPRRGRPAPAQDAAAAGAPPPPQPQLGRAVPLPLLGSLASPSSQQRSVARLRRACMLALARARCAADAAPVCWHCCGPDALGAPLSRLPAHSRARMRGLCGSCVGAPRGAASFAGVAHPAQQHAQPVARAECGRGQASPSLCQRAGAADAARGAARAQDFQFFNIERLTQLFDREHAVEQHKHALKAKEDAARAQARPRPRGTRAPCPEASRQF
jgi:hypothetical protein